MQDMRDILMGDQLRILIIDDDALGRMAVRRALASALADAAIVEADSSRDSLALPAGQRFDCLLLSHQPPPADGLEALRNLRDHGFTVPIIMLTGRGDQDLAGELMKAGASDYLSKDGLSPDRLAQSVRSAVRVYAAEVRAAQARAESIERMRFLAEASRLLTASLDVPAILSALSGLIVPMLAGWCAIDLLDAGGVFQRRLQAPPDAAGLAKQVAAAWQLIGHGAAEPPTLVFIDEALLYPPPGAPGDVVAMRVPITLRGRIHGAISMARRAPDYSQADLALAGDLAQRVAVALDNARLYQQAREAVELRDEFLSIASHELRTPLTSMLGYVQLLDRRLSRSGDMGGRDRRAIQVMVEQVMRLNKMISALLDVSRLQSGQLALQRKPVDLATIIEQVGEEVGLTLDAHTISILPAGGPLPIMGDEMRVYQVLLNLLQNAVKYSPGGGEIGVRSSAVAGWAEVTITDQGIGIPPADLPRLFDRFYRAANAEERSISGIGLGLYVVHEIVALHGGTIDANSRLGEGSTFTLRLPLLAESAPADTVSQRAVEAP